MKKWNVSNMFYVPLIAPVRRRLNDAGFVNSFMFNDEDLVEYEDVVHILFQPTNIRLFNSFVKDEKVRTVVLAERDYDYGYVMLTYELPARFKSDYAKIWNGEYSTLSDAFKVSIPATVNNTDESGRIMSRTSVQHMIMNKDPKLKANWEKTLNVKLDDDMELWRKPSIESETFKLSNYEPTTINA